MYEKDNNKSSVAKRLILDILDYLRFKVENDKLTMSEADSIARTIENNLELTGTAEDFSAFYNRPKEHIRVVINRKLLSKPKRRVFYPFSAFRKVVPDKWRSNM